MKISFDLQTEAVSRIQKVFGNRVDTKNLRIELSTDYPKDYQTIYNNWKFKDEKIPIEGFYAEYQGTHRKVILYLPVISEPCSIIGLPFSCFIRIVFYFELAQSICHNIKLGSRTFTNDGFSRTGNSFRNFFAMMVAFELMKEDANLVKHLKSVTESLSEDYKLWLTFIETDDEDFHLPGLPIDRVLHYTKGIIGFKKENITQNDIMEHFYSYVWRNIRKNPTTINHFWPVMTERQKKKYPHFGMKFGFFDKQEF